MGPKILQVAPMMSGTFFLPHFCHMVFLGKDQGSPALESSYPPIARVVVRESGQEEGLEATRGWPLKLSLWEPPRLPPVRVQLFQLHLGGLSGLRSPSSHGLLMEKSKLHPTIGILYHWHTIDYIGVVWRALWIPSLEVIEFPTLCFNIQAKQCEELTWTASFHLF